MSTTIRDIVRKNFENDKSTLLVTEDGKVYPGIDIVSESSEFIVIYPIRNLTTKQTLIYTKDIKKLEAIDIDWKTLHRYYFKSSSLTKVPFIILPVRPLISS